MNKIPHYFKTLLLINILFYSYSAHAENWCAYQSPFLSLNYSVCGPSPEILATSFCNAWANYEADSYYSIKSTAVVVPAKPYSPLPPQTANTFAFGCSTIGVPINSNDPRGLGPLASSTSNSIAQSFQGITKALKSSDYKGCSNPKTADYVRISTGENIFSETDYQANRPSKIDFIRYFSSENASLSSIALGWSHNYDKSLDIVTDSLGLTVATAIRLRGRLLHFTKTTANLWVADSDVLIRLTSFPTYNELSLPNDTREIYNFNGQLTSIVYINGYKIDLTYDVNNLLTIITDSLGYSFTLSYDSFNRIQGVDASDGRSFGYRYNQGLLDYVSYIDGAIKSYIYDDANQPNMLSGVTNEEGVRYLTWTYDSYNRVLSTEREAGLERLDFSYPFNASNPDLLRSVTNSTGNTNYIFQVVEGVPLLSSATGVGNSECDKGNPTYLYALNGNVLSKTVHGLTVQYSNYDKKHNAQTIVEGLNSPEAKTTSFSYNPNFYQRVASKTEESVSASSGNKVTRYRYDIYGNITNRSIDGYTASGAPVNRSILYEYNGPLNQLSLIDGARPNNPEINDLKRFHYYQNSAVNGSNRARLRSIDNAGIVIRSNIQYTTSGKLSSEIRTNGLSITNQYYNSAGKERLLSYIETVGTKSRAVNYSFFPSGKISSISFTGTLNGFVVFISYDQFGRINGMTDSLGNDINYLLNKDGDVIKSDLYNNFSVPSFTPTRTVNQTFNIDGRLESVVSANETLDFGYDYRNLNFTAIKDFQSINEKVNTAYEFDGLNRLKRVVIGQGITSNSTSKNTDYIYRINNKLALMIEPNLAVTNYLYDDLGNLITKSIGYSSNINFSYDEAGNVLLKNHINNTIAYTYDGLNRIISIKGADITNNVIATYDSCIGGVGRLCSLQDASGLTQYEYDGFGHNIKQTHTELGVTYVTSYYYDLFDKLLYTIYPSGRIINNFYNTIGQIESVDTSNNGASSIIVDNVKYTADGNVFKFLYGNGYSESRIFDLKGRLKSQTMPKKPIIDTTAPIITPPYNIVVEATAILTPVLLGSATSIDNVDGAVLVTVDNNGPFPLGDTFVTWSATDTSGNTGTATQSITVFDNTVPILSAPEDVWLISDIALTVVLGNATASDIFTPLIINNDAPINFPVGVSTVTWTVLDANGNSTTTTQTVTITTVDVAGSDQILPIVTGPENLIVEASSKLTPVVLGAASALDNVDGYIKVVPDQIGPFEIGKYTIKWTATDSNGNDGISLQTLTVQDTTAPIISAPANMTVISGVEIEIKLDFAIATDLFLDEVTNDAPNPFPVGTTVVTWTATDINKNSATATQIITVTPMALNNTMSFNTVSLTTDEKNSDNLLTNNSFVINSSQESTVLVLMVSDNRGETLPAKVWYRASKYSRWIISDISQISGFIPDVMMVVSDSKIDLWQKTANNNKLHHTQQSFNGKAWAASKAIQSVSHFIWSPSQPDAALRPEVTWTYEYGTRGNIVSRKMDELDSYFYYYDIFDRLITDLRNDIRYEYDLNDNLISYGKYPTVTNLNYILGTNILNSIDTTNIETDTIGNVTNDGKHIYTYNDHSRLTSVDTNIIYIYNAFGQRTRKITPSDTTVYHYNGAGMLISESDQTGNVIKEYVYLNNQPIAIYNTAAVGEPTVAYVHTDHLNTPRRITDSTGKVIWSWESDVYGKAAANIDPDGDGVSFEMNLRFYGHYFDKESELHNNNDKYYDPSTARYITSSNQSIDNEMNKFAFLAGNPLKRPDLYCIGNQHFNRNFEIYSSAINRLYKITQTNVTGLKGYQKEGILNSITTLFDTPNTNCSNINSNLSELLKSNNISTDIQIKVGGIGILTNKKEFLEIKEP